MIRRPTEVRQSHARDCGQHRLYARDGITRREAPWKSSSPTQDVLVAFPRIAVFLAFVGFPCRLIDVHHDELLMLGVLHAAHSMDKWRERLVEAWLVV